jgi:hypothetical protein
MKAVFVTLLVLAAGALANPVEVRQLDSQSAQITDLTETVMGYTANISRYLLHRWFEKQDLHRLTRISSHRPDGGRCPGQPEQ